MEHVVQFDTNQRTSPSLDMLASSSVETWNVRKKASTGAAWLSSARSVRSALKWDNERNPHLVLNLSQETAPPLAERKEGQTSSQHDPYVLGYTHVTMSRNNEFCQLARVSKSLQIDSQWGLGSATRPHERGIGSNRRSVILR